MTDPLTRAWLALIALGLATTAIAALGPEAGAPIWRSAPSSSPSPSSRCA